jgi:hypothetical protein
VRGPAARPGLIVAGAAVLSYLVVAGGVVVADRHHQHHGRALPAPSPTETLSPAPHRDAGPSPGPSQPIFRDTGRGHGLYRVIPCYLLTNEQVDAALHTNVGIAQRAAGSGGDELRGFAKEDCYWFSNDANGPYAIVSDVTTLELHARGLSSWDARRYFLERNRGPRRYLTGIGDAAYVFGPASVAVLVGDVYVDVTVIAHDGHPQRDAIELARELGKLHISPP